MNRLLPVLLISLFFLSVQAQSGTWVWMNGSDSINNLGNYGTRGVPSVNNSPPARYQAAQWTDKLGNFWIFGGYTISEASRIEQNDLWTFNPIANTWTWVGGSSNPATIGIYGIMGVPSVNNTPGPRKWGSATWTDSVGDLWMFAGEGYDANGTEGILNDLWRYHIATNEWTWMGGENINGGAGTYGSLYQASTTFLPPSRYEANTAWIDANNNLWLYGGAHQGLTFGSCSDLWKYNIGTAEWAWMGGSQLLDAAGSYGTLGIESAANMPWGRNSYTHWISGNYLYMAGGQSWNSDQLYSDVWRFNLVNNYWTWIGGDSGNVPIGRYDSYCETNANNMPVGRLEHRAVQLNGCTSSLYMFGGFTGDGNDVYNDLWSFDLSSNKWRWVSGYDSVSPNGNYGNMGVAASTNMPQAAFGPCFWSDSSGNLWLFGGFSSIATGSNAYTEQLLNVMWKYIPDPACMALDSGAGNLNYTLTRTMACPGDSTYLTISGVRNATVTPPVNLVATDSTHYYANIIIDQTVIYTISGQSSCGPVSQSFTLVPLTRGFGITTDKTSLCDGDSAHICAADNLSTYQWNTGDTTACIYAHDSGQYVVIVSQTGNCTVTSNTINITDNPPADDSITVHGDTLMAFGDVSYQWFYNNSPIFGATSNTYIASANGNYSLQVTNSSGCSAEASKQVVLTGVQQESLDNSISVFPNPTSSAWQLNVSDKLVGSTVKVFDVTGRLIFISVIDNRQTRIDLHSAASGVYELRISEHANAFVRKLVKL